MDTVNKTNFRKLRIFVGCPGDVANCRDVVEDAAKSLRTMATAHQLELEIAHWGHVSPNAGRPQGVIFDHYPPNTWDVFIGVLWHRFGTAPGAKHPVTGKDYLGGTEEEFTEGYKLWQANGHPQIKVYFCTKDYPSNLEIEQLQKVKNFQKEVWDSHSALTASFADEKEFKEMILRDLQKIIIDFSPKESSSGESSEEVNDKPRIISNLPLRNDFFGREKDLEFVHSAISVDSKQWGVFIDAIGGTGKTALAVEAAHQAKDAELFKAYIFITAKQNKLEATGIVEKDADALAVDDFINETARALGQIEISQLNGLEKKKALLKALKTVPTLLVFDNLETLESAQQNAVERFVTGLPNESKAILTSRREGMGTGRHLPLGKIEFAAAQKIIERELEIDGGLATKLDRCRDRWKELYDETYGSPLALMHILGLMRVRRALNIDRAVELLKTKEGIEERINFMFSEAREELNENDKIVMYSLSFFASSADLGALSGIAGRTESEIINAINHLGKLCLLDLVEDINRYKLHPLTREFAQQELSSNIQISTNVAWSFAQYWSLYIQTNGGYSSDSYKTFYLLEKEWQNIEKSTSLILEMAESEIEKEKLMMYSKMLFTMSDSLRRFLYDFGRWDERISICEKSYKASALIDDAYSMGWSAYSIAYVLFARDSNNLAKEWCNLAIDAWKRIDSRYEEGVGLRMLGNIAEVDNDLALAEKYYKEFLDVMIEIESDDSISNGLSYLAILFGKQEKYEQAEEYFLRAIEKSSDIGRTGNIMVNLALTKEYQKKFDEAKEYYKQALANGREVGQQDVIAAALFGLAVINEKQGEYNTALEYAIESLSIREKLKDMYLQVTRKLVNFLKEKVNE